MDIIRYVGHGVAQALLNHRVSALNDRPIEPGRKCRSAPSVTLGEMGHWFIKTLNLPFKAFVGLPAWAF